MTWLKKYIHLECEHSDAVIEKKSIVAVVRSGDVTEIHLASGMTLTLRGNDRTAFERIKGEL